MRRCGRETVFHYYAGLMAALTRICLCAYEMSAPWYSNEGLDSRERI